MYLENQESVREKSGKSQGNFFVKVCGNPELVYTQSLLLQCLKKVFTKVKIVTFIQMLND